MLVATGNVTLQNVIFQSKLQKYALLSI